MTSKEIAEKWVDTMHVCNTIQDDEWHKSYIFELQKDIDEFAKSEAKILRQNNVSSNEGLPEVAVCPYCGSDNYLIGRNRNWCNNCKGTWKAN